jgi:hypothetical protein
MFFSFLLYAFLSASSFTLLKIDFSHTSAIHAIHIMSKNSNKKQLMS